MKRFSALLGSRSHVAIVGCLTALAVGCVAAEDGASASDSADERGAGDGISDTGASGSSDPTDATPGLEGGWRDLAQEDGSFHPDDWADALVACLREQGFGARADAEQMAVSFDPVDEAQVDAFNEAYGACDAAVPIDPRWDEQLDERQLRLTFDHYVDSVIPCLEGEGFETTWDVPSFETFVARWPTAEQWNPWLQLEFDDREDGQIACPGPAFDELWE